MNTEKIIRDYAQAIYDDVHDLRGENVPERFKVILMGYLRSLLLAGRDDKAIAEKKEEILKLVRKMGTEEDGHDYVMPVAIAGMELVDLEKQ